MVMQVKLEQRVVIKLEDLKIKGKLINNHILSLDGVEFDGQFENYGILKILPSLPVRFVNTDLE
ncbi:hypothetical protein GCM10007940_08480 [Portibacter lacus]|uniref:Uncharacterized protein n=1 Tax=Portibacter lacus TaxID=1099794 RepID=A0AA37SPA9_9BACT|nr:hypothetical protein GCM10007940_08480 [Portibacter lacus]